MTLRLAPGELQLITLEGCGLAIGRYPRFRYDGRGGGGIGRLERSAADGRQPLVFDAAGLCIPPLDSRSTRFLGLPLPPGLAIGIHPERLQGWLDPSSGAVELHFIAAFCFRIGGSAASGRPALYRAPDLRIDVRLTTAAVQGQRHQSQGRALKANPLNVNADPEALLVGVAQVQPSGDAWLDAFLGLPDEALAELRCRLQPAQLRPR